jgi:hypothetical protein
MKLFIRLSSEIDNSLRSLLRYRGDLSRLIEEALTTADLKRVALLSPCAWKGRGTTASIDKHTGEILKSAASFRGCSANSLANSAIAAWLNSKCETADHIYL